MKDTAVKIQILKDEVELTAEVTAAMLLGEARRRGRMKFRTPGGIFTITYEEE